MVVTHLPSNILLILVPLMPNLSLAVLVLLVRFSISQMDVPTRQSYTMAVVACRRAVRGSWNHGRGTNDRSRHQPPVCRIHVCAAFLDQCARFSSPGTLKILYDLLLYKEFVSIPPLEERP